MVVYFYSGENENDAWTKILTEIADVAADDLDMDFEVVFSGPSRKEMFQAVSNRVAEGPAPDYVLMANYRSGAESILQYLDEQGIKTFLFNADLTEEGEARIGAPREKLKHWIGRLIPDDERAGYDLAVHLIERARQENPGRPVRLLGIAGSYANTAVTKRMVGLHRAVDERDDVELLQVVSARWSPIIAAQKYRLLTGRYGPVDAVWVANDGMAIGVIDEVARLNDDVLVGGIDWTVDGLKAIDEGRLAVSMGGHVLDIGYVMAIVKRYHEGCDFAAGGQDASLSSVLGKMTPAEEQYETIIETRDWESLDFSVIDCDAVMDENFDNLSIDKFFALKPGEGI